MMQQRLSFFENGQSTSGKSKLESDKTSTVFKPTLVSYMPVVGYGGTLATKSWRQKVGDKILVTKIRRVEIT